MEKPVLFPKPELQLCFCLEYRIPESHPIGDGKAVQILSHGRATGSLSGSLQPGSGNWIETAGDGTVRLEGKYIVRTEQGLDVPFDVTGTVSPQGKARLRVWFHCGHRKYRSYNNSILIATGHLTRDVCRLDFFRLVYHTAPAACTPFFETPELAHLYYIHVDVGPVMMAGNRPQGLHMVIPIQGGRFEGAHLRGSVLCAGADWNDMKLGIPIHSHVSTRYLLRTEDGANLSLYTEGHMNMGLPGMLSMLRKRPDPEKILFAQHLMFHTGDARYRHLCDALCVAVISPTPQQNICYDAYQVLF